MSFHTLWDVRAELIASTRPQTMVYTFIWVVVGYWLVDHAISVIALVNAMACALIDGSIMVYNDIVDAEHDLQKGKCFAADHPEEMERFLRGLEVVIALLLGLLAIMNQGAAAVAAIVWWVGIIYSRLHSLPDVPMYIVAACSASPVLMGSVASGQWNINAALAAGVLFGIIVLSELLKDIEDLPIDPGYKPTVPVQLAAQCTPSEPDGPHGYRRIDVRRASRFTVFICECFSGTIVITLKWKGIVIAAPLFLFICIMEDRIWSDAEGLNRAAVKKAFRMLHLSIIATLIIFTLFPPPPP